MVTHPHITEAKGLIAELSKQCVAGIPNKEYSNLSKLPYKLMSFVNSMNWRMKECSEAAVMLLENDFTHPSLMLIRCAMENAAITVSIADVVGNVIDRNKIVNADDDQLMRFLFGNNYRKDDSFTEPIDDRFKAERIGVHVARTDELFPGFQHYYRSLCEYVHPNYDGVSQSYSLLHIEEEYTDFGPRLNPDFALYDAFTITLVLALRIYVDQVAYIDENLESFNHLCDIDCKESVR